MQTNNINDFFRPINTDLQIPDSDYSKTDVCIAMVKALARNTNHSLYIIDYNRKNSFTYRQTRFFSAVIHRKMCNRKVMPFILMSFRLTR